MRTFEIVKEENRLTTGEVLLPVRATKTSSGYDFYTTDTITIAPQQKVLFFTDLKARMPEGEFLALFVRSSMGIKQDLMLANTVGIVDSDYCDNPSNDGNIGICLRNLKPDMRLKGYETIYVSPTVEGEVQGFVNIPQIEDLRKENTLVIPKGERICQGIFISYNKADNCNSENDRTGGIGSSGKE